MNFEFIRNLKNENNNKLNYLQFELSEKNSEILNKEKIIINLNKEKVILY
jgi:hypothetical protein